MSRESRRRAYRLGKEAARVTAKSRAIKVHTPEGLAEAIAALKTAPPDGRQWPWRYGGKWRSR